VNIRNLKVMLYMLSSKKIQAKQMLLVLMILKKVGITPVLIEV